MLDSVTLRNKLNIDHKYSIISNIPTKYRLYKTKISSIYVRDLMFDEIKALSLYLGGEYDLSQLVTIYNDVIKITTSDGNQFDLQNLELVDFHYLIIVSSILSESEASWNITKLCFNCKKELRAKFYYSDIEYLVDTEIPVPMKLNGTDKFINPSLVKDFILLLPDNIERIIKQYDLKIDSKSVKELLSFATSLDYSNVDEVIENLKLLNSNPKLTKIVKDVANDYFVGIKPFTCTCESCKSVNQFKYDFSVIRGYL